MIRISCQSPDSRLGIQTILGIERPANVSCDPSGEYNGIILFGNGGAKEAGALKYEEHQCNMLHVDISGLGRLISKKEMNILKHFHKAGRITMPCPGYTTARVFDKTAQVLLRDEAGRPVLIRKGNAIWSGLDMGEAFLFLITEKYVRAHGHSGLPKRDPVSNKIVQNLYYNAPASIRTLLQRTYYKKLETQLKKTGNERFITSYPVDITGWILIRLFLSLVKELDGFLACLGKWPDPFDGAFAFTHDVEPTKFSYTKGLESLLDTIDDDEKDAHMLDLVANHALKFIKGEGLTAGAGKYRIMSHGYYHDGAKPYLPYDAIRSRMTNAEIGLEKLFGTKIAGYRSPRYERNGLIFKGIMESGYSYSSTCPDIDRGNTVMYGGGVSLNYPFYLYFPEKDGRASGRKILEIPITSPDCIEPLLMGYKIGEMYDMCRTKLQYIKEVEGVYVCIVHAGNFDKTDIDTRMALLKFLMEEVKGFNLWQGNLNDIYGWWRERENIEIKIDKDGIILFNGNDKEAKDIAVIYETKSGAGTGKYPVTIASKSQKRLKVNIV